MSTEKSRPGRGGSPIESATVDSISNRGNSHLSDLLTPQYIEQSLDVARDLLKAGTPVIVAKACPDRCERHPGGVSEFHFPRWDGATPDDSTLDAWQPGDALLIVTGHTVDAIDTDPRNGGTESRNAMLAAGLWPDTYGVAATPSGGIHELIVPLGVRKDTPAASTCRRA